MGTQILAGAALIAGTGAGQLNQYYTVADTNTTTVTATALAALSTGYTIPAGEAYAGAAYELECGGYGTWGSTVQPLTFSFYLASAVGYDPTVGSACLSASAVFRWHVKMRIVCADGVQSWFGSMEGQLNESANNIIPGTAADNTVPFCDANISSHTASVTAANVARIDCAWGSATGGPTITCTHTIFGKCA